MCWITVQENQSPPELPWYFMKHVIRLDSDTRENCHTLYVPEDVFQDGSDSDNDVVFDVHPSDLVYLIFLCSDDFLRQELIC